MLQDVGQAYVHLVAPKSAFYSRARFCYSCRSDEIYCRAASPKGRPAATCQKVSANLRIPHAFSSARK
jgi:hypothetical protein